MRASRLNSPYGSKYEDHASSLTPDYENGLHRGPLDVLNAYRCETVIFVLHTARKSNNVLAETVIRGSMAARNLSDTSEP